MGCSLFLRCKNAKYEIVMKISLTDGRSFIHSEGFVFFNLSKTKLRSQLHRFTTVVPNVKMFNLIRFNLVFITDWLTRVLEMLRLGMGVLTLPRQAFVLKWRDLLSILRNLKKVKKQTDGHRESQLKIDVKSNKMALIFHWYAMKVLTGILRVFKISLLELSSYFLGQVRSCIGLVSVFSQSCLGLIKVSFWSSFVDAWDPNA